MYSMNFPSRRILVFGDSNTYGYDPATNGRYGDAERYPRILEMLLGPDYTVIEEGLPGRTAVFNDPLREGLCGLDAISPCMQSHAPLDALVIMLGTNDTKERFGCNARLIALGLLRLAQKAKTVPAAWRGTPQILMVCPTPIVPEYYERMFSYEMGTGCAQKSSMLFKALAAAFAEETNIRLLDAGQMQGVGMSLLDGMHLTREAHAALAKALAPILSTP